MKHATLTPYADVVDGLSSVVAMETMYTVMEGLSDGKAAREVGG